MSIIITGLLLGPLPLRTEGHTSTRIAHHADVTEHPVDAEGFVSDHIQRRPDTISVTLTEVGAPGSATLLFAKNFLERAMGKLIMVTDTEREAYTNVALTKVQYDYTNAHAITINLDIKPISFALGVSATITRALSPPLNDPTDVGEQIPAPAAPPSEAAASILSNFASGLGVSGG